MFVTYLSRHLETERWSPRYKEMFVKSISGGGLHASHASQTAQI